MRLSTLGLIVLVFIGEGITTAQTPGSQAIDADVDFSGVYVAVYVSGAPAITMPGVFPFTAEGQRAQDAYDPLVSSTRVVEDCAAETIPALLWTTNPMGILQEDGRIVFRYEEADTIRSIPLSAAPASVDQLHTELGSSVGTWVGSELIIETTHLMAGVIAHGRGYPISREARLTERYWREPGETDLQMELLVDDPVNYTEPVRFGRRWAWAPDERVRPWDCVSLGSRGSEPDIDELARQLEER